MFAGIFVISTLFFPIFSSKEPTSVLNENIQELVVPKLYTNGPLLGAQGHHKIPIEFNLDSSFINKPLSEWPFEIIEENGNIDLTKTIKEFADGTVINFNTYNKRNYKNIPIKEVPLKIYCSYVFDGNFTKIELDEIKTLAEHEQNFPGLDIYTGYKPYDFKKSISFEEAKKKEEAIYGKFKAKNPKILAFNCWSPDNNKESFLLKKINEILNQKSNKEEKQNSEIIDLSNNYQEVADSIKPEFKSDFVAEEILKVIEEKSELTLIGYSEGCFGLLESLIKVIKKSRDKGITEDLQKYLNICFIDPPTKEFFNRTKDLQSTFFWFVGWVADWVQWISGVSPDSKLSNRYFPIISDIFLWTFKQFWKFFLVPISNSNINLNKFKIKFGNDNMFNRTLFAKSRASEFENSLKEISTEDAKIMQRLVKVYLQNWRNKDLFKKISEVKIFNLNHSDILLKALEEYKNNKNEIKNKNKEEE